MTSAQVVEKLVNVNSKNSFQSYTRPNDLACIRLPFLVPATQARTSTLGKLNGRKFGISLGKLQKVVKLVSESYKGWLDL